MISPSTGGVNPDRLHPRWRRAPRSLRNLPHVVAMLAFASLRRASGAGRPEGVPTPVIPATHAHTRRTTCPDCRGSRPSSKATAVPGRARRRKVLREEHLASGHRPAGAARHGALCPESRTLLRRIEKSATPYPFPVRRDRPFHIASSTPHPHLTNPCRRHPRNCVAQGDPEPDPIPSIPADAFDQRKPRIRRAPHPRRPVSRIPPARTAFSAWMITPIHAVADPGAANVAPRTR